MVDQLFRNALTDLTARVRGSPIAMQFARVTGAVTSFGRSNPLIVTSIAGLTSVGLIAIARIKRKKKAKTTRRKKAKTTRRKKRVTHRSPRHKGHKRVSFINKKTGKRVSFLVRGTKRSPKHRRGSGHKARRFVKGSKEAKAFMKKLRNMKK